MDELPRQKIAYMEPVFDPPTRNEVVLETIKRTIQCSSEAGRHYAIVTYNLAVTVKAYSIQAREAPTVHCPW